MGDYLTVNFNTGAAFSLGTTSYAEKFANSLLNCLPLFGSDYDNEYIFFILI